MENWKSHTPLVGMEIGIILQKYNSISLKLNIPYDPTILFLYSYSTVKIFTQKGT